MELKVFKFSKTSWRAHNVEMAICIRHMHKTWGTESTQRSRSANTFSCMPFAHSYQNISIWRSSIHKINFYQILMHIDCATRRSVCLRICVSMWAGSHSFHFRQFLHMNYECCVSVALSLAFESRKTEGYTLARTTKVNEEILSDVTSGTVHGNMFALVKLKS